MENEKIDADEEFIFCDDEVTQLANAHFGITYLFPWQRLVIANIIDAYKHLKNQDSTNPLVHPHTILERQTNSAFANRSGKIIVLSNTRLAFGRTDACNLSIARLNERPRAKNEKQRIKLCCVSGRNERRTKKRKL